MIKKLKLLIVSLLIVYYPLSLQANQVYLVKDIEIENFLKDLITPILAVSGKDPKSLNIYLISDPSPNAFVYGGQNIFIHTGLLSIADSYDEIAGVLAHELGHIDAGHLSRGDITYSKANLMVLFGLAGLLLSAPLMANSSNSDNSFDILGFLSYSAIKGTEGAVLSYSRSEESQADQIALEYIKQTEYNPKGLYSFMEKLYQKENKEVYRLPEYAIQNTHPLTLKRMEFIEDFMKKDTKKYSFNQTLFEKFSRSKAKILAYERKENPYQEDNKIAHWYFLAIAEHLSGNYLLADKYIKSLLKTKNNDPYLLELLGDNYFESKSYNLALDSYKKSKDFFANNNLINLKIARSYYLAESYPEALSTINLSLQIDSENSSAWHLKSMILGKLNKDAEANLALAEKFFIIKDHDKSVYFANMALIGLKKNSKEYRDALDIINFPKESLK